MARFCTIFRIQEQKPQHYISAFACALGAMTWSSGSAPTPLKETLHFETPLKRNAHWSSKHSIRCQTIDNLSKSLASQPTGVFHKECQPLTFKVRPNGDSELPKFTLHYFAMKGRAEVIRMMLEEASAPYDMIVWWVGPAWTTQKKPDTVFGMLPVLETSDGQQIAQSNTIVRYVAAYTGLHAGPELTDIVKADMVYETAIELKDLKSELAPGAEHSDLQSMMQGKAGNQRWGKLMGLLRSLEKLLTDNGGQFFAGSDLSYADIAVFNTLCYLEAVREGCLKQLGFEMLEEFKKKMLLRPRLSSYLSSSRCYPFTELEILADGFKSNKHPMGLKYVQSLTDEQWCSKN